MTCPCRYPEHITAGGYTACMNCGTLVERPQVAPGQTGGGVPPVSAGRFIRRESDALESGERTKFHPHGEALPAPSDWIGGIALFVALVGLLLIGG